MVPDFQCTQPLFPTVNLTQPLCQVSESCACAYNFHHCLQIRDVKHSTGEQQVALVRKPVSRKRKPNFHEGKPQKEKKTQKQYVYCGLVHGNGQNCPVFGKKCMKFQKTNHFAAVCRTKNDSGGVEKKTSKIQETWLWCEETATTEYDDFIS